MNAAQYLYTNLHNIATTHTDTAFRVATWSQAIAENITVAFIISTPALLWNNVDVMNIVGLWAYMGMPFFAIAGLGCGWHWLGQPEPGKN